MGMATYHVYLHFGNSNWFSKFRKQKSQVTRILWLVALVTLITGIVAIIHWVTTFTHVPIGGVHGKLGFLMIILSIGHIVKRIKFFKGKKRMAPPSPGKASLWYADNAGRRHITVSARGLLSSGKWGSGRKNPYQARRKRTRMNGRESQRLHQRSRCLPRRCSAGAHRRDAINGCQCLHRHLLTASSPTARKTAPSLAAFAVIVIFDCLYQDCHMQQRL